MLNSRRHLMDIPVHALGCATKANIVNIITTNIHTKYTSRKYKILNMLLAAE